MAALTLTSPVPMTAAISEEQAIIDQAYACLEAMRVRATRTLDQARRDADSAGAVDVGAIAVERALMERLAAVAESKAALTFGRIDEGADRWYIGRRHVEDQHGDPVVVDWRAPVAAPFYRATWIDPLGLDLRRRFALEARTLIGVFDEDFTDADGEGSGGGGGIPDPLLAELERARTGEMRDIVATIQAEQDVVIRAALGDLIVVQGGPGTGKTAVGLHRAAYLLFSHREEMERRKLLVIGPNRVFLDYIAQVLPSLGETAAVQNTLEMLLNRSFPVRAQDRPEVIVMKGDPRMAEVIRRHVHGRIAPSPVDCELMTAFGMARFPAPEVAVLVQGALARNLAVNAARDVLREQLVALAWRVRLETGRVAQEQQFQFTGDLRKQSGFKKYLDKLWPPFAPASIVRTLLGNQRALAGAADGLLGRPEQRLLHRRPAPKQADERWTRADLGLLDEADALVSASFPVFGHVVVDEAQDLSAMELRMVARRAHGRSMTVLGDLAQATSVAARQSWADALTHLTHDSTVAGQVCELELGYRVPAPILDFANRLLPIAAPGLRPSRSVRTGGESPQIVLADDVVAATVDCVRSLTQRSESVGVLAAPALIDSLSSSFHDAGIAFAARLDGGVTLLTAVLAKGLEFDAVVVVEPAAIYALPAGPSILYVALSRAVQHLSVVHGEPLPAALLG